MWWYILHMLIMYPGEKDRVNEWLAQALVGTALLYVVVWEKYQLIVLQSRQNTWVQMVQKLMMLAFRSWSKLVVGDTQGRWSLVAEGSNAHRIKALLSNLFFWSHWKWTIWGGIMWWYAQNLAWNPCIYHNKLSRYAFLSTRVCAQLLLLGKINIVNINSYA